MFGRHRRFWRYVIVLLGLFFIVQVGLWIFVFYEPPFHSREVTIDDSLTPTPDFIYELRYQPNYRVIDYDTPRAYRDDVLAIVVDQEALWRNGDQADDLTRQIGDTAELEIAGQLLMPFESYLTLVLRNMGNGDDLVGTVGDPINFLFSLKDTASGTHEVTFRVTDTGGIVHQHTWRIVIE
ncbi:MAG: hypothetical protein RLP44_24015 [Aggregatilineales bacterium]